MSWKLYICLSYYVMLITMFYYKKPLHINHLNINKFNVYKQDLVIKGYRVISMQLCCNRGNIDKNYHMVSYSFCSA